MPLSSGSLCPLMCLSAMAPGLSAHLSDGDSEAPGSLALGADPQALCPLAAMGTNVLIPLPEGRHRAGGAGGALTAAELPAGLQPPPLGPRELLAL